VAQSLGHLCSNDIHVIPNGIDLARFRGGNGAALNQRYTGKYIILSVGRLVREKNLQLLIKAAPYLLKMHDIIIIIVGKGPARRELEALAQKKGVSDYVVFTGYVSDEKLIDYYKAASVFAFPSTYETQGVVALEAMAAGVPVVAANARALPDVRP
jgi:glycosyltransferase involved in cell wall biosynthesis